MNRLGAAFWLLLVLASGFATFKIKYAVQDIEDQLGKVRRQIVVEQQEIRVLTAEWTFLTQPERLAELNRRFLGLAPIATSQLQQRIEDIPLRPPPAPPDTLLAAEPEPGEAAPVAAEEAGPIAVAAAPAAAAANPPAVPPPDTLDELITASLEAPPAAAASAAAAAAKPAVVSAPFGIAAAHAASLRSAAAPPPDTLDALIAQIAASR
jgi:hypothetical protein